MSSFADLVQARVRSIAAPDDASAREDHEATRGRFEAEHGRIVHAWWSTRQAAGLAMCCRHLSYGRLQWSLHHSLGGLGTAQPEFAPVLRHVAGESARASAVLFGRAQRLAVSTLFDRSRHVMAALEAS